MHHRSQRRAYGVKVVRLEPPIAVKRQNIYSPEKFLRAVAGKDIRALNRPMRPAFGRRNSCL